MQDGTKNKRKYDFFRIFSFSQKCLHSQNVILIYLSTWKSIKRLKKVIFFPLIIVGTMFFAIGFALGINSYLIPLLNKALQISSGQSYLVIAATFSAFLIFGYPASLVIAKIGYKKTMALSFLMFAVGFYLFIPSAKMESLPLFLFASFISGMGNTFLTSIC